MSRSRFVEGAGAPATPLPPRASEAGFRLLLERAQLTDLIQVTCQNGASERFEVRTGLCTGRLYFQRGRLVHAECEGETGFEAVVTMLGWSGGEAVAIGAAPAPDQSIDIGCEALLLRAAHRLDEARRSDGPRPEPTTGVVPRLRVGHDANRKLTPRPPPLPSEKPNLPPPPVSHRTEPPTTMPPLAMPPVAAARPLRVVRMSQAGTLRQLDDRRDDALADRVFVAARAAQALGDALGLGRVRAFHLHGDASGLVVCCGESITGVEGRCEPLAALTEKLGVA